MRKAAEIYAFIGENPEEEGIVASILPYLGSTPLVRIKNDNTLMAMKIVAQQSADATGRTVRLVKFTRREDLQTFTPKPNRG